MTASAGVTAAQINAMLMQSLRWDGATLGQYQRTQLEQLLRHAKAQVPFYATRLDCMFRRDGTIDWRQWRNIPVVTRTDLRDRRDEMQARNLPPGHGPTKAYPSSGSTGIPISYSTTRLAGVFNQAAWARFYALHGMDQNVRMAHFKLRGQDHRLIRGVSSWQNRTLPDGSISHLLYIRRSATAEQKLAAMARNRISAWYDFATNLTVLARHNLEAGRPVQLGHVISFGMSLADDEIDLLQHSFGCKVLVAYSSKEGGLMAYSCPHGGHYHVCAESVLLEPMDAPPPDARQHVSRVVITPFFHTAQPLIRYDQGDEAEFLHRTQCVTTLPMLGRIVGRADPPFHFNGKPAPVVGVDDGLLINLLSAKGLQIAQTGPLALEVRYMARNAATQAVEDKVKAHLRRVFGTALEVRCRLMDDLPRNAGGKQNRYVAEWRSDQ